MKTIYINGIVYTGGDSLCQAFITEQERFVFVGGNEDARRQWAEGDSIVDLKGRFVCAGFNDSHMHVVSFGYSLGMAELASRTGSMAEIKEAVRQFIKDRQIPAGSWVRGRGWNHDYFADGSRFPTRWDLDEISTEHPICLTRACGHACVVNSRALEQMGLLDQAPQMEGGCVEIGADGRPNGILRENAMELAYSQFPQPSLEDVKQMILRALKELNRYGITSSHTDDFTALSQVSYRQILKAFQELKQEGRLTVRINEQSQFTDLAGLQEFVEQGYHTGWGDEWFRIGPLKLLGDGSLGARTAYLTEPYADDPTTRGIPIFTRQQLEEIIGYAHAHGMQVAVHAIGDGILDDILSAYRKAIGETEENGGKSSGRSYGRNDHRHGIVHCQIMRPDQLEAFRELSLHAYIQSIFLDYDLHIVEERVGKERAASSYHYRTLFDTVHTSNGSDCPVELPRVLAGIQCAVTRKSLKDQAGPYLPDQAMTVKQAIDSYTKEGAFASFEEKVKGQIQPGMLADFVILGENPFDTDVERLKDIPVWATYVGGVCRYRMEDEKGME